MALSGKWPLVGRLPEGVVAHGLVLGHDYVGLMMDTTSANLSAMAHPRLDEARTAEPSCKHRR